MGNADLLDWTRLLTTISRSFSLTARSFYFLFFNQLLALERLLQDATEHICSPRGVKGANVSNYYEQIVMSAKEPKLGAKGN